MSPLKLRRELPNKSLMLVTAETSACSRSLHARPERPVGSTAKQASTAPKSASRSAITMEHHVCSGFTTFPEGHEAQGPDPAES
eukprot:2510795-Rhodomonas_salina.1